MSEGSEEIVNATEEQLIEWILEGKVKARIRACEAEMQRRIARELTAIREQLARMGGGD